ncbi:signal peptidase I [Posidoniimonas polymericola]|uniref:Signal peptidase I n=1 Tax=Posidoniimonas polymericola TaxID=2528002 RepID=A0A5C5YQA4_9BACT|nr:S26 family signal peptidase [Posidoniimonas polymericola]TWT77019.1 signal peptidase I [Posidoniimonas polymericola]
MLSELHTIFRRGLLVALGFAILVISGRTLLLLGMMQPVVVRGSSMAPTLEGERWTIACPHCQRTLTIGVDQLASRPAPACLICGSLLADESLSLTPADQLVIDRTDSRLDRWDRVVFHCPHDALELCIKRVWGLPGEVMTIAEGDVFADGVRLAKPFSRQIEVRRLEHRSTGFRPRWQTDGGWRLDGDRWQGEPVEGKPSSLTYDAVVHDDHPGNVAVRRRFNQVNDLMIDVSAQTEPAAVWQLMLPGGHATLDTRRGLASISNHQGERQTPLATSTPRRVQFSNFDHRLVVGIDGQELLSLPANDAATGPPPTVRVLHGRVTLQDLSLYKDIYYEGVPLAWGATGDQPWLIGPDEYFVLGDNQAVSVDSRRWETTPGLPRRLILGRPYRRQGW